MSFEHDIARLRAQISSIEEQISTKQKEKKQTKDLQRSVIALFEEKGKLDKELQILLAKGEIQFIILLLNAYTSNYPISIKPVGSRSWFQLQLLSVVLFFVFSQ